MAIIIGKIKTIQDLSTEVHKKSKATIKTKSNGTAFIEFRGPLKKELENYQEGDEVVIEHRYEGKVSRSSGIQFNNLPAISIKKL